MRLALAIAALLLPVAALSQSAADIHAEERGRLGYGELRPGADGDASAPNGANYDEALVGDYHVPSLFETGAQQTPGGWPARRAQLAQLVEDNWVGRVPDAVAHFTVAWEKTPLADAERPGVQAEHWQGRILTPDGRSGPIIDAIIHFPAASTSAPALIAYTYMWPGGRVPDFGGSPPPDGVQLSLDRGWAHVEYHPQLLQPDAASPDGIIGLARWPRERHDWGALRAWAWGASQLREELARDPRIAPARVSLTGHSRFGKGVLVAAAFDHAFADAHVSSSGAGGASLMRRDFGELWENMAGSGAFHWFTPAIMGFAGGERSVHDLPVDAHSLIALRAPRPLFITSGLAELGDAWVDPVGMWTAMMLAQPAWAIFGASVPRTPMPVPESTEQANYPLGWYQHGEGHVPWPAYAAFYDHAERFAD